MIYRVSWDPDAFLMLQQIWDEHEDVTDLVIALDEIHSKLSEDAEQRGESRSRGRRILISPPLAVEFQAQPRIGEVLIVRVWFYRRRGA
jgi:hypothetical protein